MSVKLLTEHNLEFLSLKGGCTGSSESTLGKMPHCWKSHVTAQMVKASNDAGLQARVRNYNKIFFDVSQPKKYVGTQKT